MPFHDSLHEQLSHFAGPPSDKLVVTAEDTHLVGGDVIQPLTQTIWTFSGGHRRYELWEFTLLHKLNDPCGGTWLSVANSLAVFFLNPYFVTVLGTIALPFSSNV